YCQTWVRRSCEPCRAGAPHGRWYDIRTRQMRARRQRSPRWPANERGESSSLHGPARTSGYQRLGAFYSGNRPDAQIVGGRPNPESVVALRVLPNHHLNTLLPGRIDVTGRVLASRRDVDMLAAESDGQFVNLRRTSQLNVKRKRVSVEDRSLEQHQGRYGSLAMHDAVEISLNPLLDRLQRRRRVHAVAIDHVESYLGIEDGLGQLLER